MTRVLTAEELTFLTELDSHHNSNNDDVPKCCWEIKDSDKAGNHYFRQYSQDVEKTVAFRYIQYHEDERYGIFHFDDGIYYQDEDNDARTSSFRRTITVYGDQYFELIYYDDNDELYEATIGFYEHAFDY